MRFSAETDGSPHQAVGSFKDMRRHYEAKLRTEALTAARESQRYLARIDDIEKKHLHQTEGLKKQNAYYRDALAMIAEPPPMDALHKPTWREMGRILSARITIAAQALRGGPLERESPAAAGPASDEVLDADREREPLT